MHLLNQSQWPEHCFQICSQLEVDRITHPKQFFALFLKVVRMGPSKYIPLSSSSDTNSDTYIPEERKPGLSRSRLCWLAVFSFIVLVLAATAGVLVGHQLSVANLKSSGYNIDKWSCMLNRSHQIFSMLNMLVEYVTRSFEYNRTFSEAPSPETDAAWMSIFPPHGGFFHDKTVAPSGASLAVYHQLHCLVSIQMF